MKWNVIGRWLERRTERRKLKELSVMGSVFMNLERLTRAGLLSWDGRSRRLFIDADLALLMMRTGADGWAAFVQNVYLWLYSRLCDEAWAAYMQKEELKAVREYRTEPGQVLSRQDVERIREARRREIAMSDMEPPKVEGFEFFIVKPPKLDGGDGTASHAKAPKAAGDPVGELAAVGHYDPETGQIEMASWEDVKPLLSQDK